MSDQDGGDTITPLYQFKRGARRAGGPQSIRATGTEKRNALQKVIFTRFLEQRLRQSGKSDFKIGDLVTDLADGSLLVTIVECLSGQKYPGKALKAQKMRIMQINQAGEALKWVKKQGIEFKCSPEDLVDGAPMFILGMIFKIIIKYMKLDEDDEESADVKEALRLWVLNKMQGYDTGDDEMKSMTKPFHNGLIFCALIHRMRPKLIDFASLKKENKTENLEVALSTAEKFCNVERYISVEDISDLDELGMVVYVYDWYYGISLLQKQDNAARRIGKLADMTKLHDSMKADFDTQAASLVKWIEDKGAWLAGREVDNTMDGIKSKIDAFFKYKTDEKAAKLITQMDLEALYNDLALRLHNNKRPAYSAPVSIADVEAAFVDLAQKEAELSTFLYAELSRQNNLLRQGERILQECNQFKEWLESQRATITDRTELTTVADAEMAVESHNFFEGSNEANMSLRLASIEKQVSHLETEKYEKFSSALAAKNEVIAALDETKQASADKKNWVAAQLAAQHKIDDDLCKAFADAANEFESWLKAKKEATSDQSASLESQLSAIESISNSDVENKIKKISEMATKIAERHIVVNPYTQATEYDLTASSQQFSTVCEKRKQLLEGEIKRRDQSGITDEQIKEVNDNFDYFDKDNTGTLDKREMRMCLQSLGEEMTPANVKAIIAEYDKDNNGTISRDEFRGYMLTRIGDTDSQEEILNGFSLLTLGAETVNSEQMEAVVNQLTFKDHHVDYLKQEMPAKDDGYDYSQWTTDVFAR